MCGIAGVFAYGAEAPPVDEQELLRIREHMIQRGPDGAGLWLSDDRRVGLAHRRLAIIDLSDAGAQPMSTVDGRLHITCNGEIYNYRELRKELEAKGCTFRSNSDTEVLLHLYAAHGADMVHKLRGMFAFGIWDARERALFLARDPFGMKPLYYADTGRTLRFASQVKALLAGGALRTVAEPAGYVGFLLWGSVPEPWTLHREILALPAGCTLRASLRGADDPIHYFNLTKAIALSEDRPPSSASHDHKHLREALEDTVDAHLVADVPVGLFLSAGVDSNAIASTAARRSPAVLRGVTLGFDEYENSPQDEIPLSSAAAQRLGIDHRIERIENADFESALPGVINAMDQPTIDGLNTYFVARAARRAGMKVALSGVGGDEVFGGYPSFRQIPRAVSALGWAQRLPWLGRGFRYVAAPVCARVTSPKYAGVLEYGGSYAGAYLLRRGMFMPWELPQLLEAEFAKEGWARLGGLARLESVAAQPRSARWRVGVLEVCWYLENQLLRDTDWASMAHSLEVRLPFVDPVFAGRIAAMKRGLRWPDKDMLSVAAPVDPEIAARAKTGFTVPLREWLGRRDRHVRQRRGLRGWALRVLSAFRCDRRMQCLLTDSFGGRGGIAKFNRDLLESLNADLRYRRVSVVPRVGAKEPIGLPQGLGYAARAASSLRAYVSCALAEARDLRPHDAILCGHINLLPLAWIGARRSGARLILVIHGIDAWHPARRWLLARLVGRIDLVISVSRFTFARFQTWARTAPSDCFVLPNAYDERAFAPGARDENFAREYGVGGRKVILTMGRLNSTERYKGVDEILEALPLIAERYPDIYYVVAGTGDDVARLIAKARALGIHERVRFVGYVDESRKADLYRLADAYVMPGRGEGFGIVYLEAMACGVPVLGSTLDASLETLREGRLGSLANPSDRADVVRGVLDALSRPRAVPSGLEYYSITRFRERVNAMSDRLWWSDGPSGF